MTSRAEGTLALWEALSAAPPLLAGAALLHARGDAPSVGHACDAPLATAAAAALDELRHRCGDTLDTLVTCPACGIALEAPLPVAELAAAGAAADEVAHVGDIAVRAPTTRDLLAALTSDDPAGALRTACLTVPPHASAPQRRSALAAAEQLCGAAALTVTVSCPECGERVTADADPVALLAERVAAEAARLLRDVADLAVAYGWSERAILDLSPTRRAAYLALAGGGRR